MQKRFALTAITAAISLFVPFASFAASPADAYLGKILIDTAHHGEAWYVNPQTHMRVYLGRPDEALSRLKDRASYVTIANVDRVAASAGLVSDAAYVSSVAGTVLTPSDIEGASWYVDPGLKLRRRLASPADAWDIMKSGLPAKASVLNSIAIEPSESLVRIAKATVKDVLSADTLSLADGTKVRILNVSTPSNPDLQAAAASRLKQAIGNNEVTLERDVDDKAADGAKLRHVFVGDINLGFELVRDGLAFHDIAFPNFRHADQMIVGQLDAARLKRGFWLNESTR